MHLALDRSICIAVDPQVPPPLPCLCPNPSCPCTCPHRAHVGQGFMLHGIHALQNTCPTSIHPFYCPSPVEPHPFQGPLQLGEEVIFALKSVKAVIIATPSGVIQNSGRYRPMCCKIHMHIGR